jgi:CHAT domain-containing protein
VLDAQARAQQALAENFKGETLESWQRLTQSRSVLSRLLLNGLGKQSPEDYKKRIAELQAAVDKEEEFLARPSSLIAEELAQRQVTTKMLAGRLSKDSALVEFVRIRDWDEQKKTWSDIERYLAFVLTPENQVTLVDLGEARKIDTKIKTTLTAIDSPDFDRGMEKYIRQADDGLAELYTLLLQPLETALGSRQRLIVSPDGELNNVPLAALRTPDGRYLVEQMTISYVASGRDLLRGKTDIPSTVDLLLVANPAFDNRESLQVASAPSENALRTADCSAKKFATLERTAEEARIIPSFVKGTHTMLEGKAATESAVHAVKSPKVLHLATHGFFCKDENIPLPEPMTHIAGDLPRRIRVNSLVRSGLALAGANHATTIQAGDDGLLTALEVSSMDLHGTDLVVLSACETASGDVTVGEGGYGLRRAFVLAGAKNLVMSLWKVGDFTTQEQMTVFYRTYGEGKSPAEALRQAQLQTLARLRKELATVKDLRTPVKLWAPFIVQQTGE